MRSRHARDGRPGRRPAPRRSARSPRPRFAISSLVSWTSSIGTPSADAGHHRRYDDASGRPSAHLVHPPVRGGAGSHEDRLVEGVGHHDALDGHARCRTGRRPARGTSRCRRRPRTPRAASERGLRCRLSTLGKRDAPVLELPPPVRRHPRVADPGGQPGSAAYRRGAGRRVGRGRSPHGSRASPDVRPGRPGASRRACPPPWDGRPRR